MQNPSFFNVSNLSISYDNQQVVDDVSFDLAEGELACLLGPSGCGKTTILRAISGFQTLNSGTIELGGKLLANTQQSIAPESRNVGMVFQDHALFPHLSVYENVCFGLKKLPRSEQQKRIADLLNLVGIEQHKNKYPHELSGGQSQRVAIARAIAPQPKLLLMDEPFSNLDSELRESLGYEVRDLLKQLKVTAIMVTHDQLDAFALGDQVGVMSNGRLMQWDSSFNLYHAPKNRFTANFIGEGTFIKGHMIEGNVVITPFGEIKGQTVNTPFVGQDVDLLLRPDDIKHNANSEIRCKIIRKAFKGAQTLYTVEHASGSILMCLAPSHDDFEVGDIIGLEIDADHLVCFDQQKI